MGDREIPRENGAASTRPARLRAAGRAVICTAIAAFVLVAFPVLAAAFAPIVTSPSATPTSNGATLSATVYPYGLNTTYHFEYGTTTSYGTSVPVPDADAGSAAYPGTVQVHEAITGLTLNTTYHFRLVAHNSDGMTSTTDQTFTTLANPPSVVANAASTTAEGFDLSGTVNPHGADATYHFEYGTTTSYGTKVPAPDGDAGSGSTAAPVSQEVKNAALLPNTTYHFRLVAKNSGGSTSSSDQTFTTPPSAPAAPSAVASPPIEIAAGEYKLEGGVNPNKLETKYHFEFGATTSYGKNLPEPDESVGSGETAVPVSQEVTGLAPNTTYHYRVVANNSDGPGTSLDQVFTTPPSPPEVVATPFTETAGGFDLNGTINPNGGDTTYHFQFGFTTAYGSNIPASDADAGSGTGAVPVSQRVTGLPPNVVYHYRLVAHNAGGTSTSGDQVFTTPPATPIMPKPPVQLLPPPVPPTNQFSVRPGVAKGTAVTLQVSVPGPGTLSASGKQLKAVTAGSSGAGMVALKLKLTSAGLKALKKAKSRRLTVKVKITFQPTGGSPGITNRTVTFKMKRGKS
jgi:phosphodiesterase/alkaline phosphatase D-like protein